MDNGTSAGISFSGDHGVISNNVVHTYPPPKKFVRLLWLVTVVAIDAEGNVVEMLVDAKFLAYNREDAFRKAYSTFTTLPEPAVAVRACAYEINI